jgi:hypothetical protein
MLTLVLGLVLTVPQSPILLSADFDTGTNGFTYADDTFRGTTQPSYASGVRVATGGFKGGALRVSLGGLNNNQIVGMSGGWSRSFTVPDLGTREVVLEFRFRIDQTAEYESDEFSQAMASVDNVLHGQPPFDAGCKGTAGIPTLAAGAAQLPWLGASLAMVLGALPKTGAVVGMLGFSDKKWGTKTLPYDLAALRMPGCTLLVSPDFLFYLTNAGGTANWSLSIPTIPALVGLEFFVQGVAEDPGANRGGMVVTKAAKGRLGQR